MSESAISSQVPPLVNEIVPERCSSARRHVHLFIFCLAEFPAIFSVSAMFPAIPSVARDLHIPENDLTWIINSFNLTASAFLLIVRPSDTFHINTLPNLQLSERQNQRHLYPKYVSFQACLLSSTTLTISPLQNIHSPAGWLFRASCLSVLDLPPTQSPSSVFKQ